MGLSGNADDCQATEKLTLSLSLSRFSDIFYCAESVNNYEEGGELAGDQRDLKNVTGNKAVLTRADDT